jgi:copper chaperone NosL
VEADRAFFVVGSKVHGGMGAPETVPFSVRADAEEFAKKNGGRVSILGEIKDQDVLGTSTSAPASSEIESNG